jgi:hypothetical protein
VTGERASSWLFPVVVVFSLLRGCALLIPSHPRDIDVSSKADRARIGAKQIAYEAFARWSLDHPHEACPSPNELTPYLNDDRFVDPWGTPFDLHCVRDGKPHVVVRSFGEDRRAGTGDDIWSTDP